MASNKFPECRNCINREFDPFQCDDCEDASNYEPEEEDDDYEDAQEMSIGDFKDFWNNSNHYD